MPSSMTMGQVAVQDPVYTVRVTVELPVQVSIRAVTIARIIRTASSSSSSNSQVIRASQSS